MYVPEFKIAYDKRTGRFTAAKVKVSKSYEFMREISENAYFRVVDENKEVRQNLKRKLVTPSERPERDQIISDATKYTRLNKTITHAKVKTKYEHNDPWDSIN